MRCKQHGEKIETPIGYYNMCKVTGLPCPYHGIMTFHEDRENIQDTCNFADELFKIDPELTIEMEHKQHKHNGLCPKCDGKGFYPVVGTMDYPSTSASYIDCEDCGGTGHIKHIKVIYKDGTEKNFKAECPI